MASLGVVPKRVGLWTTHEERSIMSWQKSWLEFPGDRAALDILDDPEAALEGCRRWAKFTPLDRR
jgi:hypothetical protein